MTAGAFRLLLEVGSRQWGGNEWALDLNVGRFDQETGEHDGSISWSITRHEEGGDGDDEKPIDRTADLIRSFLRDEPWQHTKSQVVSFVGGNRKTTFEVFGGLVTSGEIIGEKRQIENTSGQRRSAHVYALSSSVLGNHSDSEPATAGSGTAIASSSRVGNRSEPLTSESGTTSGVPDVKHKEPGTGTGQKQEQ